MIYDIIAQLAWWLAIALPVIIIDHTINRKFDRKGGSK